MVGMIPGCATCPFLVPLNHGKKCQVYWTEIAVGRLMGIRFKITSNAHFTDLLSNFEVRQQDRAGRIGDADPKMSAPESGSSPAIRCHLPDFGVFLGVTGLMGSAVTPHSDPCSKGHGPGSGLKVEGREQRTKVAWELSGKDRNEMSQHMSIVNNL